MKSTTIGEYILKAVLQCTNSMNVDLRKLVSVTTDGAPAMTAKVKDFSGPDQHARRPHPIKNKNMLTGRRFTPRGPRLARGLRVADPWFKLKTRLYT